MRLVIIVIDIVSLAIFTAGIIVSMCTTTGFSTIEGIATVYHRVFLVTASVLATSVAATVRTTFFCFNGKLTYLPIYYIMFFQNTPDTKDLKF